jgi:hypothetical protein
MLDLVSYMKNIVRVLVTILEEICGRPTCGQEDNIKMDLQEVGGYELDSFLDLFCSELRLLGLYGHSNKPTVFV